MRWREIYFSFQSSAAEMQAIKCVVVGDGAVGEFNWVIHLVFG